MEELSRTLTEPQWKVCFFGPLTVRGKDRLYDDFETQRSAKLLALVALSGQGKVLRANLGNALWPEDFEDATRLRLRQELARLRRALGDASEIFTSDRDAVSVSFSQADTDYAALKRAAALPEDAPRLSARLQTALDACHGIFLDGWDDHWVLAERRLADRVRIDAAVRLSGLLLAESDAEGALRAVANLFLNQPTHEGLCLAMVKAKATLGRLSEAMADFQEFKRQLKAMGLASPEVDLESFIRDISVSPRTKGLQARLPAPIDRFFGREAELAEIESAVHSSRLVMLLGPGGIGKTRLTVEFGNRHQAAFAAVGFATLDEIGDAIEVPSRLLEAFGLATNEQELAIAYLARSLPENALLIVDNLEHLLPDAASPIIELLQSVPTLKILATSRTPLGIPGEQIITIGPLDRSGTLDMLTSFWRGSPDDETTRVLGELAVELEGMPLAVQLAGSRLRLIGPAGVLGQVRVHVDLEGSKSGVERHRSIANSLHYSLAALDTEEREAFERIATLRWSWDYQLAERLLGPDASRLIERFLDVSLLTLDDHGPRILFRVLAPIRQVMTKRVAPEVAAEVYRAYQSAVVEGIEAELPTPTSPLSLQAIRRLDVQWPALEAMIHEGGEPGRRVLQKIGAYLTCRGWQGEAPIWIDSYLSQDLAPTVRAELLVTKGRAFMVLNENLKVSECYREAESLFEDPTMKLHMVVMWHTALRRIEPTQELIDSLLGYMPRINATGDRSLAWRAAQALGHLYVFTSNAAEIIRWYEIAVEGAVKDDDILGRLMTTLSLAGHLSPGSFPGIHTEPDHLRAARLLSEIGPYFEQLGDPSRMAALYEVVGKIALEGGRAGEAETNLRLAHNLWSRIGNIYQVADQSHTLAKALILQGKLSESKEMLIQAAKCWLESDDFGGLSASLNVTALRLLEERQTEKAAGAVALARAFLEHYKCTLVSIEMEVHDRVTKRVGPLPKIEGAPTVDQAWEYFRA